VDLLKEEAEQYPAECTGPGRPRDSNTRIEEALEAYDAAEAAERREKVREAAREISNGYPPFDLERGAVRDAETVEADLQAQYAIIDPITTPAGLNAKCHALLGKARRLVPQRGATLAFVHSLIAKKVEALELAPNVEASVLHQLIPMHCLEQVARKAPKANKRAELRRRAAILRPRTEAPSSVLSKLEPQERETANQVALECAQLFQRSSSNVEGRKGVLALRNHSLHRLSPRKLGALTVVHNFGITRADGTTAAQRFFGQSHRDLFKYLHCEPPATQAAGSAAGRGSLITVRSPESLTAHDPLVSSGRWRGALGVSSHHPLHACTRRAAVPCAVIP
jgi:hypothetical protein